MVGLFDSIMVGHYSTADLAAVSFSNALFFTVMVFAMGALMGITPIVGYAVGASEHDLSLKLPSYPCAVIEALIPAVGEQYPVPSENLHSNAPAVKPALVPAVHLERHTD